MSDERSRRAREPVVLGSPSLELLTSLAITQGGCFSLEQAAQYGYSRQLVLAHVRRGLFTRVGRGLYCMRHWPDLPTERHAIALLWARRLGADPVFSHRTALQLHGLWPENHVEEDADMLHMLVPPSWQFRRLRRLPCVRLWFGTRTRVERTYAASMPVVRVDVALNQCVAAAMPFEAIASAYLVARLRGLVTRADVLFGALLEETALALRASPDAAIPHAASPDAASFGVRAPDLRRSETRGADARRDAVQAVG
ncbi:MAG: type IV toxin-antitoxin system AbiEi family antitoxin domain-containing protein [Myxococcales bacterium]|nr:type IV toxin-antitoxin system AbiEi family antitoxin domain-containing protein [Myxococcales bacterium]